MDLQTNGGKPVTSENVPSIDNLRAHSPQIPDDNRLQPDTQRAKSATTTDAFSTSTASTTMTRVPPAHCQAQGRVRYTYFSDNRTTFLACPDAGRPKCSVQFVGSKPNNILPTQRVECSIEQLFLGHSWESAHHPIQPSTSRASRLYVGIGRSRRAAKPVVSGWVMGRS